MKRIAPIPSRREMLGLMAGALVVPYVHAGAQASKFRIATFSADLTPPIGHPLLGGLRGPAKRIADPLLAHGIIFYSDNDPIVILSIDWCELRNGAYDAMRNALAKALSTRPERILLTCVHQHDAPYCDLEAQKLLDEAGLKGAMFDHLFFEKTFHTLVAAARLSSLTSWNVTHIGIGEAKVSGIASNRRVQLPDGRVNFSRLSFTPNAAARDADEGTIDPMLKTLSFWDADRAVASISFYATHPMSHYGAGEVSADFPGLARKLFHEKHPGTFHIYATGCAGDITAGKFNTGNAAARKLLAERLEKGMSEVWEKTRKIPLEKVEFRNTTLKLAPRTSDGLDEDTLRKQLADATLDKSKRILASLGLSWQARCKRGQPIDVPFVDFGPAAILLLPAESFVAYQLAAAKLRPDLFLAVAGFGECAPGYIPTDLAEREGFVKEHQYCWVAEQSEREMLRAISAALKK